LDREKVEKYERHYRDHGGMYMGAFNARASRNDVMRTRDPIPLMSSRAASLARLPANVNR
jgi:hypothetical protein